MSLNPARIPAQLFATVAEVFDALTSEGNNKVAWTTDEAIEYIIKE